MRHDLQTIHPESYDKVKFYIGNVRDRDSLTLAMQGEDYDFLCCSIKGSASCEFFPMEEYKTNVEGTNDIVQSAVDNHVKSVVLLSTDKAAYPINAMGISEAMVERIIYSKARYTVENGATLACIRYGNVMCSRESAIPLLIQQIKSGREITITDSNMTRFLMNLDESVALVMFAFQHANSGDLFVQKADVTTIGILAKGSTEGIWRYWHMDYWFTSWRKTL